MNIKHQSGRKLGAIEKFFWLNDQNRSNHFAIAAELSGQHSTDAWTACLRELFSHRPHAMDKIIRDSNGDAWFAPSGADLDLRVSDDGQFDVAHSLAMEINRPFNADQGPLMRAVLLQGSDRSAIIFSAHHAIADGMSLTFVLRDLLSLLGGDPITFADRDECLEQRVREVGRDDIQKGPAPGLPTRPPVAYREANACAAIELKSFSKSETHDLRLAAREQGTTVHGAISAAVSQALTGRMTPADGGPLRILVPLDARKRLLEDSEHLGVFVAGSVVSNPEHIDDLWSRARGFDAALQPLKSRDGTTAAIEALESLMAGVNSADEASARFAWALGAEVMVTNLGALAIPDHYGRLRIDRLWGPVVSIGFTDEQSIGVATLAGRMTMVHASYKPLVGLLQQIRTTLDQMCIRSRVAVVNSE